MSSFRILRLGDIGSVIFVNEAAATATAAEIKVFRFTVTTAGVPATAAAIAVISLATPTVAIPSVKPTLVSRLCLEKSTPTAVRVIGSTSSSSLASNALALPGGEGTAATTRTSGSISTTTAAVAVENKADTFQLLKCPTKKSLSERRKFRVEIKAIITRFKS
ncbi:MAG: hypothetical protein AAGA31_15260, partial [Bacteroidota bacterium]